MAGKLSNIIGNKYGKLTVIKFNGMKGNKSLWECKCDCGNTCIKRLDALKEDSSCGCYYRQQKVELAKKLTKRPVRDIIGNKYGKLTVIKFDHMEDRTSFWECKCDCGNTCIKPKHQLGKRASCGCYNHGDSNTRFYKIFSGMKSRCYCKTNEKYHLYGGRNIKVEWKDYQEFKKDMYDSYIEHCNKYGEKNTSIDRIDSNGNYCKDNCRWATIDIQNNNTSRTIYVEMDNGVLIPLTLFCNEHNLDHHTIYKKYKDKITDKRIKFSEFKNEDIV